MMSSFKANGLGTINLSNGKYYIGPFKNGKFDTSCKLLLKFNIKVCLEKDYPIIRLFKQSPIYSWISASTTIGTYVLPDGTVYEGQYRDGVAVGIHREKLGNAPPSS